MNDSTIQPERTVKAHPTKAFFVRMLTRDISLTHCILDLIDNAVDAAWARVPETPTSIEPSKALANYSIQLSISESTFQITDNCGGISLDDAATYAFTFGRETELSGEDYSIGVYGIGMKRAVFKLGNTIRIASTSPPDRPFVVPINVEEWIADTNDVWDFHLDDTQPLPSPGVDVTVTDLTEDTRNEFSDPTFTTKLGGVLARYYMLPLLQGLRIEINGSHVEPLEFHFRTGEEFQPYRAEYSDNDVKVDIVAGLIGAPPDNIEPEERPIDTKSGWYVLCNGRVVVAADRTDMTVWGRDSFPNWHYQYNGFAGVVLFSSQHPDKLPMTTTKTGVDPSSAIYRRAIVKMQRPTRDWINYTNQRKISREVAREKESSTTSIPIQSVQKRKRLKLPKHITGPKDANILFVMPEPRVKALAKAFDDPTMPYKEVGIRSFEYAYEQLVDEDPE